ncbi:UNVERIFIED_CONTAM: hypothetical protein Sradi_2053400 [Sesamum radiatum]|uniref:Uncharacterized protein n=1 Tax=Sesamum radiatum TaxID=300843 RepID=A0AAW2TKC8_SESRA
MERVLHLIGNLCFPLGQCQMRVLRFRSYSSHYLISWSANLEGRKKKLFNIEVLWARVAGCEDTICWAWDSLGTDSVGDWVIHNLCNVHQELVTWEK